MKSLGKERKKKVGDKFLWIQPDANYYCEIKEVLPPRPFEGLRPTMIILDEFEEIHQSQGRGV